MANLAATKIIKGSIAKVENGKISSEPYIFQFNPSVLRHGRKAVWGDLNSPGGAGSMAMFVRVDSKELDLELFLAHHRARSGAVKGDAGILDDITQIESWALPSLDTFIDNQFQYIPPPRLLFSYGPRVWWCTARTIEFEEVEHNENLYPTRAIAKIKLKTDSQSFEELMAEMTWYNQRWLTV